MDLRFVVGTDAENAFRLDGVFTEARILRDRGELYAYEVQLLNETFAWFNENLPCPPFTANLHSGRWTREAVSWFRDDAGEPLRRIWAIVAILREHGTLVRAIRSARPGRVVYRDRFQVVAETPDWA